MRKMSIYIKNYVKLLTIGTGVLFSIPAFSQTNLMEISDFMISPDNSNTNNFGASFDVHGDYAVVGARKDKTDDSGNTFTYEKGSAFVYKKDASGNWVFHQKLVANNPLNRSWYGHTVRISDSYLVVATRDNISMYIYEKDSSGNWVETQEIENTFRVSGFGDIEIAGDLIAVSDARAKIPAWTGGGFNPGNGHVYFYEQVSGNWAITDTVSASNPNGADYFGSSIEISGNHLIVGAENRAHDYQGPNQINQVGAVYAFEKDQNGDWVEIQKMDPTVPGLKDRFGRHVALSGDHLVVSTAFEDEDENEANTLTDAGSVYFYHFDNGQWNLVNKRTNSDRVEYDYFSFSIDIEGDKAIIGASRTDNGITIPNNTPASIQSGSAYIFEYDGSNWNETNKIISDQLATQTSMGSVVKIHNNEVYIFGANNQSDGLKRGLVYHGPLTEPYLVNVSVGNENKKVTSDRDKWDDFGYAVDISGDWAIAGAPREDNDLTGSNYVAVAGSAYLFKKDSNGDWTEMQKLITDDRDVRDFFGHSVSIDGDYAVIGGYNRVDNQDGAAYIFKRNADDTWSQMQKLTRVNNEVTSNFYAWDVSVSGDRVFIGAPEESVTVGGQTYTSAGKVYVYELDATNTWVEVAELTSSDIETGDRFGYSIDIDGSAAIIGAYFEDLVNTPTNTNDAGAAYIFNRDASGNWTETQKISADNPYFADYFGYDVAIHNNFAVIGAFGQDHDLSESNYMERAGGAYIFENQNGTWTKVQELIANDREGNDRYGSSVAIYGNHVLVGAFADGDPTSSTSTMWNRAGAAYLYEEGTNGTWYFVDKITSAVRHEDDYFGNSVAISNNTILIGAPFESEDEFETNTKASAGAIYFYDMIPNASANKTASAPTSTNEVENIEQELKADLIAKAYPNPVQNTLNIQLENNQGETTIQVINLNGQIVEQINVFDQNVIQVQMENIPAGIYFVKINTETQSSTVRIIKN